MILTKTYPSGKILNNVFDEFFGGFPQNYRNNGIQQNQPAANILETTDAYHLELNVPGRAKEDFKVNIDKQLVTISYDKKEEQPAEGVKTIRNEFSLSSFKRTFSVNEKINTDSIEAKYENGILKLVFPKKEEVKVAPKQIQIQ